MFAARECLVGCSARESKFCSAVQGTGKLCRRSPRNGPCTAWRKPPTLFQRSSSSLPTSPINLTDQIRQFGQRRQRTNETKPKTCPSNAEEWHVDESIKTFCLARTPSLMTTKVRVASALLNRSRRKKRVPAFNMPEARPSPPGRLFSTSAPSVIGLRTTPAHRLKTVLQSPCDAGRMCYPFGRHYIDFLKA